MKVWRDGPEEKQFYIDQNGNPNDFPFWRCVLVTLAVFVGLTYILLKFF